MRGLVTTPRGGEGEGAGTIPPVLPGAALHFQPIGDTCRFQSLITWIQSLALPLTSTGPQAISARASVSLFVKQ